MHIAYCIMQIIYSGAQYTVQGVYGQPGLFTHNRSGTKIVIE